MKRIRIRNPVWGGILHGWVVSNAPHPAYSQLTEEMREVLRTDTAEILDFHNLPLTDPLKSQLKQLTRVTWLRVSAGITAEDLDWLGKMRQLRGLSLAYANLTGADFGNLASVESLQWVNLRYARMSDREFASFPRLTKLEVLVLAGPSVTDECLTRLASLQFARSRFVDLVRLVGHGQRY